MASLDPIGGVHGRPGSRKAAVLLGAGLALGLLVTGAGLGQLLWPAQPTVREIVVSATADPSEAGVQLTFPSVEGLDELSARAVIADAGFSQADVKLERKAAAGPEDYVVGQSPAPGTPSTTTRQAVVLTLSQATVMPDLIGKSDTDARAAVEALAGVAQVRKVVNAEAVPGTVLATSPKAGEPMGIEVILDVADGGTSLSLLDLTSVAGSGCRRVTDVAINGRIAPRALSCRPAAAARPGFVEYAVGRHAVFLDADLGMDDRGATGKALVKVVGDEKVLATSEVAFGKITPLHVDVRGVLRLRIEAVTAATDSTPQVILGEPRLVGVPAELDQIGR